MSVSTIKTIETGIKGSNSLNKAYSSLFYDAVDRLEDLELLNPLLYGSQASNLVMKDYMEARVRVQERKCWEELSEVLASHGKF